MLLEAMITSFCLNTLSWGQYNQACNKALDAAITQTGWKRQVNGFEDKTRNHFSTLALAEANDVLGRDAVKLIGGGVYIVNTVRDKKLKFSLPTFGFCSSLANEIAPTSYVLRIGWKF